MKIYFCNKCKKTIQVGMRDSVPTCCGTDMTYLSIAYS